MHKNRRSLSLLAITSFIACQARETLEVDASSQANEQLALTASAPLAPLPISTDGLKPNLDSLELLSSRSAPSSRRFHLTARARELVTQTAPPLARPPTPPTTPPLQTFYSLSDQQSGIDWNVPESIADIPAQGSVSEGSLAQSAQPSQAQPVFDLDPNAAWATLGEITKKKWSTAPFDPGQEIGNPSGPTAPARPVIPYFVEGALTSVQVDPKLVQVTEADFFTFFQGALRTRIAPNATTMKKLESRKIASLQLGVAGSPPPVFTNTTYEQWYEGLPVIGSSYQLISRDGVVVQANGRLLTDLNIRIANLPLISVSTAFATALSRYGSSKLGCSTLLGRDPPTTRLAISTRDYTMKRTDTIVVWQITCPKMVVEVDAVANVVRNAEQRHMSLLASGTGLFPYGTNPAQPHRVPFIVTPLADGSTDLLQTKPGQEYPYSIDFVDSRTTSSQLPGASGPQGVLDSDHNSSFDDPEDKLPVSLMFAMQESLRYFSTHFSHPNTPLQGWLGIDGAAQHPIKINLIDCPPGEAAAAYWETGTKTFGFSNLCTTTSSIKLPPASVDVVGHELTHAIDRTRGGHVRPQAGVPGAITEGLADIFGTLIRRKTLGITGDLGWETGTDIGKNGPLRSLKDPLSTNKPEYLEGLHWIPITTGCVEDDDTDHCGIHRNSTVVSHWFYLLARGGKGVEPIGEDLAATITFAALKHGLLAGAVTLTQMRDAIDGAALLVQQHEQLISPSQMPQIVMSNQNAWAAVGVGERHRNHWPKNGEVAVAAWPAEISWDAFADESNWRLEVSTTAKFEDTLHNVVVNTIKIPVDGGGVSSQLARAYTNVSLPPGTGIYWRVRPVSAAELAGTPPSKLKWSDTAFFRTNAYEPELLKPNPSSNANKLKPWSLEFTWKKAEHSAAESYRLVVHESPQGGKACSDTNIVFNQVVAQGIGSDTVGQTYSHTVSLKQDKEYSYAVLPVGPNGSTKLGYQSFCGTVFETKREQSTAVAPAGPNQTHVLPQSLSPSAPTTLTLGWTQVKNASRYALAVSSDKAMTQNLLDPSQRMVVGDTNTSKVVSLPPSQTGVLYWTVTPIGPIALGEEMGLPSEPSSFVINPELAIKLIEPTANALNVSSLNGIKVTWQSSVASARWGIRLKYEASPTPALGTNTNFVLHYDCPGACPSLMSQNLHNVSENQTYFIQVCAVDAANLVTACSELRKFTTQSAEYPAPVATLSSYEKPNSYSIEHLATPDQAACTSNYMTKTLRLTAKWAATSPYGSRVDVLAANGVTVLSQQVSSSGQSHYDFEAPAALAGTTLTVRVRAVCNLSAKPCAASHYVSIALPNTLSSTQLVSSTCGNSQGGNSCPAPEAPVGLTPGQVGDYLTNPEILASLPPKLSWVNQTSDAAAFRVTLNVMNGTLWGPPIVMNFGGAGSGFVEVIPPYPAVSLACGSNPLWPGFCFVRWSVQTRRACSDWGESTLPYQFFVPAQNP